MQYRALPVEVTAHTILSIDPPNINGYRLMQLRDHGNEWASPEMLSRIDPQTGDYWVKQADDYIYLNPKDVFERKYAVIDRVGPRIEKVVGDDPGDATRNSASIDGGHKTRAVDARYALACEITRIERRAARMRILMDALPRAFWERPDAVEVVNDVLVGLSLP